MTTQSRLKELFNYNKETGALIAAKNSRGKRWGAGRVVGSINSSGYLVTTVDKTRYLVHRLVWLYENGDWPQETIDHIDGNPLNNRLDNLRDVSQHKNNQNRNKVQRNKKYSELLGAQWCKRAGRWKASIRIDGRIKHIGFFESAEKASTAYLSARDARNS